MSKNIKIIILACFCLFCGPWIGEEYIKYQLKGKHFQADCTEEGEFNFYFRESNKKGYSYLDYDIKGEFLIPSNDNGDGDGGKTILFKCGIFCYQGTDGGYYCEKE